MKLARSLTAWGIVAILAGGVLALGFVAVVSSNRSSRRENAAQAVIGAPYETESYGDQLLTGVLAGTAICAVLLGVILLVYVGVRKIRHSRT